jgi:hemerythrin
LSEIAYNAVMRTLKWNSSHAVFVAEIDDDHKEIFDAVAELQGALSEQGSAADVNGLTERLALRIEDHFAHEERLMRAARYGLLSWHKRGHDAARKRIARFIKRIGAGDTEAGTALIAYLAEWLHNHTRLPDRMLGAFLRNQRRTGKIVFTTSTKSPDSCAWLNSRGECFDPTSGSDGF